MWLFEIFRFSHIIAGFVALFIFWIPIVTKKGGKTHRKVGWIYVLAMGTVAVSAFYMGFFRIFFDSSSDLSEKAFSWFLIFISILSFATVWYGLRVLQFKRRTHTHRAGVDYFVPVLLLLSGLGISIYGFTLSFPLLQWFPLLGFFVGSSQLLYWLRPPRIRMQWWIEHLVGMLSCCISTITAFTVFGAPRLLNLESEHPVLWFIPTLMIVPLIIGFTTYYSKKFHRKGGLQKSPKV